MMKVGKTIGGKREAAESESERMQYREKVKKRKITSILIFFAVMAVIFLGVFTVIKGMRREQKASDEETLTAQPSVEIVDEASVGVSRKAREFVGNLEQDLKEYSIRLSRAVLPRDKTREVDVYVDGFEGYFKLSLDRGTGVAAEDMERMIRYLKGLGFKGVEYVDLRVEGKGYYKGAAQAEEKKEEEPTENNRGETEVEEAIEEENPEEEISSVFVREGELNGEENPDEIPAYEGDPGGE